MNSGLYACLFTPSATCSAAWYAKTFSSPWMNRSKVRRESLSVMVSTSGFLTFFVGSGLSQMSSSRWGSGATWRTAGLSPAGTSSTSSEMFWKAACARQSSMAALFLSTVFCTRRMLVEILRVPSSRETGLQLLSIAASGSLISCSSSRSSVSAQRASASVSMALSIYVPSEVRRIRVRTYCTEFSTEVIYIFRVSLNGNVAHPSADRALGTVPISGKTAKKEPSPITG